MPAARLTTRLPSLTWSWISSSRPPMSCGLTTSTSVSAIAAASALSSTRTPYFSVSSAARSARRSVMTSSSAGRPAQQPREEGLAHDAAPKIATVPMSGSMPGAPPTQGFVQARGRDGNPLQRASAGGDEGAQEEAAGWRGARPSAGRGSRTSPRRTARRRASGGRGRRSASARAGGCRGASGTRRCRGGGRGAPARAWAMSSRRGSWLATMG